MFFISSYKSLNLETVAKNTNLEIFEKAEISQSRIIQHRESKGDQISNVYINKIKYGILKLIIQQ